MINNQQDKVAVTSQMEQLLYDVANEVVQAEELNMDPEISLLLVDDPEIQSLNHKYRGINRPTDVLSFAMEDEIAGEDVPDFVILEDNNILGDIVISLETAQRQAEEYGHSLEREVGFLAVHGMLHLLGYDHGTEEDSVKMRTREESILAQLGLSR
ncbi:MAG: rRNA maturation RNase YbeY [Dehalobacterium sp.]